ncbi:MAG: RNA methyltransferase [Flavobacteriales bacterium]
MTTSPASDASGRSATQSATQAELKRARALHGKKEREATGRFLVQGHKMVSELLASAFKPQAVFASAAAAGALAGAAKAAQVQVHMVPDHELQRLGTFDNGNEVVAVVQHPPEASDAPPTGSELVLALDGVHDPGNLGTVLRIADRFGVRRVVCGLGCVDVFNPKCVQATMGSILRVAVRYDDLAGRLGAWRSAGVNVYLADGGGTNVFATPLARPAVLVLGSESHGLSQQVLALEAERIAIPQFGGAESLNVATAAAALCMEFARRIPQGD